MRAQHRAPPPVQLSGRHVDYRALADTTNYNFERLRASEYQKRNRRDDLSLNPRPRLQGEVEGGARLNDARGRRGGVMEDRIIVGRLQFVSDWQNGGVGEDGCEGVRILKEASSKVKERCVECNGRNCRFSRDGKEEDSSASLCNVYDECCGVGFDCGWCEADLQW